MWPYDDDGMILRPSRTKKSHIVEALVQARKSLKKYMSDEGEQDWEDRIGRTMLRGQDWEDNVGMTRLG